MHPASIIKNESGHSESDQILVVCCPVPISDMQQMV